MFVSLSVYLYTDTYNNVCMWVRVWVRLRERHTETETETEKQTETETERGRERERETSGNWYIDPSEIEKKPNK